MKKTILLMSAIFLTLTGAAYCATQYQRLGNVDISSSTARGGFGLWQRTSAQLQSLTPTTTGQIAYCSNCSYARVCVSTSVWPNSFVAVSSGPASKCN